MSGLSFGKEEFGCATTLDRSWVLRHSRPVTPKHKTPIAHVPLARRLLARLETKLLLSFLAFAGLILSFGRIAEEMLEGDAAAFDKNLLLAFRNKADLADPIGPPSVEEMVRDVTALGSYTVLGLLWFTTTSYLLMIKRRALALWITSAFGGAIALDNILKFGFQRPRPDIVPAAARVFSTSFPSGHATVSAAAYLTLGLVLTELDPAPRIKAYFIALAILITVAVGVSRVYLGLHYPTDVLAGWCAGAAWALLCWSVVLWLRRN
jgi:undecaprenyl-diphosphatase